MNGSSHAKIIFCCGMFRSGTTLLGRVLNAHPAISLESDPFLNFFKVIRSHIAHTIGLERPRQAPIGDYYFSSGELRLLSAVQNANLAEIENHTDRQELWQYVRRHGEPYAPRVMRHLDEVSGGTYREMLQGLFGLTASPGAEYCGVKEVWIDEFIPALARSFPEMKFVEIIRDPRAVCSSKNVKAEKYPWLFLCRQWRKLAALAWTYSNDESLAGRVHVVRYEDLVREPEPALRRMTEFLGLPFADEMLDPSNYLDGAGERWQQNTSYVSGTSAMNAASAEKWRTTLSEAEVAFIEAICGPEMKLFGYEFAAKQAMSLDTMMRAAPLIKESDIANWMKAQYPVNRVDSAAELAKESLRHSLLSMPPNERIAADRDLVESGFLSEKLFRALGEA